MTESSFTFLRVRGISIGAHWSWVLIFALIVWSLSAALFPQAVPGLDDRAYLVMGLVTGVLFFASILLHELGHAFQALKEGMRIDGITLWLFGGVARFKGMFPSPGAEFRIAIAGPVVTLVLAVAFFLVRGALDFANTDEAAVGVVDYLARINVLLLLFNLVPALPLDGGRVLRSWLWRRQRSFRAATASAARAGKAFGGMLAFIGLLGLFTGGTTGGLWLVFLGWFLVQAAQAEAAMVLVRQAFSGMRARDVMTPDPLVVPPHMTVADFFEEVIGPRGHTSYPVASNGELRGLVSMRRAGEVPVGERSTVTVERIMVPRPEVPTLSPDTDMIDAFEMLQDTPRRAVVMDGDRIAGILSISDAAGMLRAEQARGPRAEQGVRRAGPLVWLVVGALMLTAAGALYRPPVVVIEPGQTLDVSGDIEIDGVPVDEPTGDYLLTSVRLRRPNALGVALAAFDPNKEILALDAVIPRGVDTEDFSRQQRELFDESRMAAAAAAAQAVGIEVDIQGSGARVDGLLGGSPADEVLREGDVIVAVNGREIRITSELQQIIRARPAGTTFSITVERDGDRREFQIESARIQRIAEGAVGIGVVVSTRNFSLDLPFEIDFAERDIGGPSAGLAYALAIADMLDRNDYARGRTIATTGTVTFDGSVGAVGSVDAKAVAADRAGAELFLVPQDEVEDARETGLEVLGVTDLEQALRALSGS